MCYECVDCDIIYISDKEWKGICNGFKEKETKKIVIRDGHLTTNYRWCSNWTHEQITAEEKRLKPQT